MGECDQPVVGMKSCFEYSEKSDAIQEQWKAREWFMVLKAEVHLSEDNVLIPYAQVRKLWDPSGSAVVVFPAG